ncbi:MAG TPA: FdtA/QdtA family cupin domain-containing protein [Solirubrobacteraceae bacterium]|nr:FdtA/QdtA family cupin domain-containing protein [Solirubrobacteraceae bacterium]
MSHYRAPGVPSEACCLLAFARFDEPRGSLCVAEEVGFEIKRAYWIFDLPEGAGRANHAHREQYEVLVAVRGSFTVHCDYGSSRDHFGLDSPDTGLLIPPMVFHDVDGFSADAVCLVFASGPYEHAEYVRDYDEFRELASVR